MEKQLYQDPIIREYVELFKANLGTGVIKTYYQGDPMRIPESNLPAMIISKDETRVGQSIEGGSNMEDGHEMAMVITVVSSIRKEINDDKSITPGIAKLYDIIEGREDSTFKLKTNSVLHVLRNNVFVNSQKNLRTDLNSITRVDYGFTLGNRDEDAWAAEGQVEFVAHFSQLR